MKNTISISTLIAAVILLYGCSASKPAEQTTTASLASTVTNNAQTGTSEELVPVPVLGT